MTATLAAKHQRAARARQWRRWRRPLGIAFALLVLGLIAWAAAHVDWPAVGGALAAMPLPTLLAALALAAASHLIYSTYDLLGRAWIRHSVPAPRVMEITFISYAFNLNLGTLIGGLAFRLRLYARAGLATGQTMRVLGLSLATNWLGYALLAGALFASGLLQPPPAWPLGAGLLRALGVALLAVVAGWLLLCARRGGRRVDVMGHELGVPRARLALLQLLLSCANWLTIAAVIAALLGGTAAASVRYVDVLGALLLAAIAGAIAHVPAGLGVIEGVFVALLTPPLGAHDVLAALLAYRAIYYLLPLGAATALYFLHEARAGR